MSGTAIVSIDFLAGVFLLYLFMFLLSPEETSSRSEGYIWEKGGGICMGKHRKRGVILLDWLDLCVREQRDP